MIYVILNKNINLLIKGQTVQILKGELVKLDLDHSIAYHDETGLSFDINKNEYGIIN